MAVLTLSGHEILDSFLFLLQSLEDSPDAWFNAPKGWLKKPDFKRAEQKRDAVERRQSIVKESGGVQRRSSISLVKDALGLSGYKDRWFVLDSKKRLMTYYKDTKDGTPESGRIDISRIVDIQYSEIHDAPEFSLDLVSIDQVIEKFLTSYGSVILSA